MIRQRPQPGSQSLTLNPIFWTATKSQFYTWAQNTGLKGVNRNFKGGQGGVGGALFLMLRYTPIKCPHCPVCGTFSTTDNDYRGNTPYDSTKSLNTIETAVNFNISGVWAGTGRGARPAIVGWGAGVEQWQTSAGSPFRGEKGKLHKWQTPLGKGCNSFLNMWCFWGFFHSKIFTVCWQNRTSRTEETLRPFHSWTTFIEPNVDVVTARNMHNRYTLTDSEFSPEPRFNKAQKKKKSKSEHIARALSPPAGQHEHCKDITWGAGGTGEMSAKNNLVRMTLAGVGKARML